MTKVLEATLIDRGENIREENDNEIMELAESISKNGLLNPLTVVRTKGRYKVVAGHRRFKALQILGEPWIECNVLDYEPTRKEILMIQLQENCCRRNLSAWEYADIFAKYEREGVTRKEIAYLCGKSEAWVSQQYITAKTLEQTFEGNVPEEAKKMSYFAVKKTYGSPHHKLKQPKKPLKGVSVQRHSGYITLSALGNKEAQKELEDFIEQWSAKWQNSKTSELQ